MTGAEYCYALIICQKGDYMWYIHVKRGDDNIVLNIAITNSYDMGNMNAIYGWQNIDNLLYYVAKCENIYLIFVSIIVHEKQIQNGIISRSRFW